MTWVGNDASLDYRPVNICGVNYGLVHMHDSGVIGEGAAAPLAAGKSDAAVSEAVIHAAVVADVRPPIAFMEDIAATLPAPIVGGPQKAGLRRRHPGTGNPEVVPIVV
jgi:hypothetical protein